MQGRTPLSPPRFRWQNQTCGPFFSSCTPDVAFIVIVFVKYSSLMGNISDAWGRWQLFSLLYAGMYVTVTVTHEVTEPGDG